jgi:hypothetical protein
MNTDIALWGLGVLAALVSTLALALLKSVQQQGRDTNEKVTKQGEVQAGMVRDTENMQGELSRLRDSVSRINGEMAKVAGAHELATEIARAMVRVLDERNDGRSRERLERSNV